MTLGIGLSLSLSFRAGEPPFSFSVSGSTGGSDYLYAPLVRDRTLWRTTLVAQDEDVIDLQAEFAIPGSPTCTSWSVSGADSNYFYALSDGKIAFKASTRASITPGTTLSLTITGTNAYGSNLATLSVVVPADADCRFVSIGSGSDANNGTTPALAWAHVPRNYGFTGTPVTLGAGKVLFFKAEIFRSRLAQTDADSGSQLQHGGTAGNNFVYSFTGWGGRATIDGSDTLSGGTTPSQVEVNGNTNYLSLTKYDLTSQGGAAGYWQHMFAGDQMLYPAQWPTPASLPAFSNPNVDETGGFWRVAWTTDTGVSPRMNQPLTTVGATITIVDARIAARYGNVAVSELPPKLFYWGPNNETSYISLDTYDYATSTITALSVSSGYLVDDSGYAAYALVGGALDIVEAGQFAWSADELTRYAWLPNADTVSIARRSFAITSGQVSYVTYSGAKLQRTAGNSSAAYGGTSGRYGGAIRNVFSATTTQVVFSDIQVTQTRADAGEGTGIHVNNNGLTDSILERFHFTENPRAAGLKLTGFQGLTGTPTAAQVAAYAWGKVRYIYCAPLGLGRTYLNLFKGTGVEFYDFIEENNDTIHGNGVSPYDVGATSLVNYNYFHDFLIDNSTNPYTTSIAAAVTGVDRHNTLENFVVLASEGASMQLNSGEPGGVFNRGIIMFGASYTGSANGVSINKGYGLTITNSVIAGITGTTPYTAAGGGTLLYDFQDNLLTVNSAPPNVDANQIQINTVATGAPIRIWDKVLTAEMEATLGPGRIGLFWNVP